MKYSIVLLLLAIPGVLCASSSEEDDEDSDEIYFADNTNSSAFSEESSVEDEGDVVEEDEEHTFLADIDYEEDEFLYMHNIFASRAYRKIAYKINGNFVYSPLALLNTLLMLLSGSSHQTADELLTAINISNIDTLNVEIGQLLASFSTEKMFTLDLVTKLYTKKDLRISPTFKKLALSNHHASVERIDFSKQTRAARKINKWMEKNTHQKIKKFVNPKALHSNTTAIAISVVQIKAKWDSSFLALATTIEEFFSDASDMAYVKFIHHHEKYLDYGESKKLGAKFLRLPLEGESGALVLVLSNNTNGVEDLEGQIDQVLDFDDFAEEKVNVVLPRFQIRSKIDFKQTLTEMGINRIFDKNKGDLSGIAGKKGDLEINRLVQEIIIDVSEGGLDTPAFDFFAYAITSGPNPNQKSFVAKHPFIFYVELEEVVVLIGRVKHP